MHDVPLGHHARIMRPPPPRCALLGHERRLQGLRRRPAAPAADQVHRAQLSFKALDYEPSDISGAASNLLAALQVRPVWRVAEQSLVVRMSKPAASNLLAALQVSVVLPWMSRTGAGAEQSMQGRTSRLHPERCRHTGCSCSGDRVPEQREGGHGGGGQRKVQKRLPGPMRQSAALAALAVAGRCPFVEAQSEQPGGGVQGGVEPGRSRTHTLYWPGPVRCTRKAGVTHPSTPETRAPLLHTAWPALRPHAHTRTQARLQATNHTVTQACARSGCIELVVQCSALTGSAGVAAATGAGTPSSGAALPEDRHGTGMRMPVPVPPAVPGAELELELELATAVLEAMRLPQPNARASPILVLVHGRWVLGERGREAGRVRCVARVVGQGQRAVVVVVGWEARTPCCAAGTAQYRHACLQSLHYWAAAAHAVPAP